VELEQGAALKRFLDPTSIEENLRRQHGPSTPFVFSHLSHTASHTTAQPNQASGATRAMRQLADDEQLLEWLRWLEEDGNWQAKQGLAVCEQGGAAWREVCACYKAIWSHCD